jgi:hypothetical protein
VSRKDRKQGEGREGQGKKRGGIQKKERSGGEEGSSRENTQMNQVN